MSELEVAGRRLNWADLMSEALTTPGKMGETYNRFYEYSFNNQLLLHLQGVHEPVATLKRWNELGRRVVKGSKAKAILRPVMGKQVDDDGEEVTKLRGFKMVKCLFGVSETEGDPLPEYKPKEWDRTRALGKLAISQVDFTHVNGNIQGISYDRNISINPVAVYPLKTTMHEVAHIEHGHTAPPRHSDYLAHRGIYEAEAEGSAYIVMNELDVPDAWDQAESRAYVQGWLRGGELPEANIRRIFKVADSILRAGRD